MNARFILAKYAPCLRRMEPRNIGVFLWVNGAIHFRFLDVSQVDGVEDEKNYRRWLDYWKSLVCGDKMDYCRYSAPLSDPKCMDVLLKTQNGNYILADAGEIWDEIKEKDVDAVMDQLFEELVLPPKKKFTVATRVR